MTSPRGQLETGTRDPMQDPANAIHTWLQEEDLQNKGWAPIPLKFRSNSLRNLLNLANNIWSGSWMIIMCGPMTSIGRIPRISVNYRSKTLSMSKPSRTWYRTCATWWRFKWAENSDRAASTLTSCAKMEWVSRQPKIKWSKRYQRTMNTLTFDFATSRFQRKS